MDLRAVAESVAASDACCRIGLSLACCWTFAEGSDDSSLRLALASAGRNSVTMKSLSLMDRLQSNG
jgi:hypothetical protein